MAKYIVSFNFATVVECDEDIDIIGEDVQNKFTDDEFNEIVGKAFKKLDLSCPEENVICFKPETPINVDSIERLEE